MSFSQRNENATAIVTEDGTAHIFGPPGHSALCSLTDKAPDDPKVRRAGTRAHKMRTFAAFDYSTGSWKCNRRAIARLDATICLHFTVACPDTNHFRMLATPRHSGF